MSEAAEKLDDYRETILEFQGPPPFRVDLRRPVSATERAALARVGLVEPFAVLTAENPCGEHADDAPTAAVADARESRNQRRTARLLDHLEQVGAPAVRVDGVAPGGDHRERCVATPADRAAGVALAKRFEQIALFWFDGRRFWLLPAESDGEPQALP
jgi:hypothetical protein